MTPDEVAKTIARWRRLVGKTTAGLAWLVLAAIVAKGVDRAFPHLAPLVSEYAVPGGVSITVAIMGFLGGKHLLYLRRAISAGEAERAKLEQRCEELLLCSSAGEAERAELERKCEELLEASRPAITSEKFERFEDFAEKGVNWAYVEFWPTATYNQRTCRVAGIGVEFFEEIFSRVPRGRLKQIDRPLSWANMLEELRNGSYDVLVTPVYETRERLREVAFCAPLFYTDIGLFVRVDDKEFEAVRQMSYEELCAWADDHQLDFSAEYIEDELHAHLSNKIFRKAILREAVPGSTPYELLDRLRNPAVDTHRIQFIERWQGEREVGTARLRNLLKPGAILFPVSFIVRPADDTLRRFINLKLLEIGDRDGGRGVHELLKRGCDTLGLFDDMTDTEKDEKIAEFFRRSMPTGEDPPETDVPAKTLPFRGSS